MEIRKNDIVQILSGKYSGKKGKVLKVFPSKDRIIVEGVNFIKKHVRAGYKGNQTGGIIEKEAPIHVSNVMVICGKCNRPVRISHKILETGKAVRVCNKCDEMLTANQ